MTLPHRAAVLFDLDGTLTNPFEGITNSIRYAFERLGRPIPAAQDLKWCIGPPLQSCVETLFATDGDTVRREAIRLYRERYATIGIRENRVIDGIPEILETLADQGFFLSVATSKITTFTLDILEHFDLRRYFDAVHGAELDGTNSRKEDLVRHILDTEGLEAARTVMVGDRMHDVAGARANGVATIGVLWGYGDREELEDAGAVAIAAEPGEIAGLVNSILRSG